MNSIEAMVMWVAVGSVMGASSAVLLRYWTNASFAVLTLVGVFGSVGWGVLTSVMSAPFALDVHMGLLDTMLLPMFGSIIAIAFFGSFAQWQERGEGSSGSKVTELVR